MKLLILAALAACSLAADTLDGVTYILEPPSIGPGSVEYTWLFATPVSGYTIDVTFFGAPPDLEVFQTFGSITQESTQNETLYLTLSGTTTPPVSFLSVAFQSDMYIHTGVVPFPTSLQLTSLTGVPEPATICLTALGLIGLFCMLAMRCLRNHSTNSFEIRMK